MFCDFENRYKTFLAKSHHKYSKLNEFMLKRFFSKTENIEFLLQKKFYDAEILYGARHFNCGWKIDKINKKIIKEKNPMPRIEPRS
jgi:hypothetical protein